MWRRLWLKTYEVKMILDESELNLGMDMSAFIMRKACCVHRKGAVRLVPTTLVHCASGNRVGALIALQHGLESGDVDAAIAEGKRWGLTRLEPVVRNALTK